MELIKKIISQPRLYWIYFYGRIVPSNIENDKKYLRKLFKYRLGRELNFDNPQTYNEKLQWMKLYDKNPNYTILVDKHSVREYVEKKCGSDILIPLLGVWEKFEDIKIEDLPDQFVLKCSHDSGGLVICHDKKELDLLQSKKKIKKSLKKNYYFNSREWPYKNVPPRIIGEKYIGNKNQLPIDYKFFCFNGSIDSVMLCLDREKGHPNFIFFDMNWKRLRYQKVEPILEHEIACPPNFDKMIAIVEKLCKEFKAVRVDLYNVDGQIYFGELTYFNQSGFDTDITYDTDLKWGNKLDLEINK